MIVERNNAWIGVEPSIGAEAKNWQSAGRATSASSHAYHCSLFATLSKPHGTPHLPAQAVFIGLMVCRHPRGLGPPSSLPSDWQPKNRSVETITRPTSPDITDALAKAGPARRWGSETCCRNTPACPHQAHSRPGTGAMVDSYRARPGTRWTPSNH